MAHEGYHEPADLLSPETKDMHRAVISLIEELEAIDWYQQRAEACTDDELRSVLAHNRDEEVEHAAMTLEWIRRRTGVFDEHLRTYLYSSGPITAVEQATEAAAAGNGNGEGEAAAPGPGASSAARPSGGSLGIGSLKGG